jgi:hypothetical protein
MIARSNSLDICPIAGAIGAAITASTFANWTMRWLPTFGVPGSTIW